MSINYKNIHFYIILLYISKNLPYLVNIYHYVLFQKIYMNKTTNLLEFLLYFRNITL